jgi:uncharacterized protein YdiU (UPF0061 family)
VPLSPAFRPSTAHALLGDKFFDRVRAAPFPAAILRHRDDRWAARIGFDTLTDAEWVAYLARFEPLPGSHPEPLALRYHGHQFRHYNADLGDGRGFLYAQLHDLKDGRLLDLGTKGSGKTPWSRAGDGRLTLKGGVREVLATEMLEAQGVYTSKSLSLVETGEALQRHDEPSPTRSAVLVRLSHGHIRIGSFQRQAALGDAEALERLLNYSVTTYVPEAQRDDLAAQAVAFLEAVCARVARLGAQWMAAGFVHGVLNTDNINITGESFDYGPWRWLPAYDPAFTAAYFDESGLYAYGRQPETLQWNLTRLAECLLPFADKEALIGALETFAPAFRREYDAATLCRLLLPPLDPAADAALARAWWVGLAESQMPFEAAFFGAAGGELGPSFGEEFAPVRALLAARACPGRPDHPYFRRPAPCTVLIDEVEALWAGIAGSDDWSAFHAKITAIREMGEAYGLGMMP